MKLATILSTIRNADETKTASVATPAPVTAPGSTSGTLKTALDAALAAPATATKVASGSPVADLQKIASTVAASDEAALVKEAQLYGQAVADGFIARLTQYNDTATKMASANPSLSVDAQTIKHAQELGYNQTLAGMDKLAEAAYGQGYEEATNAIYKIASDCFSVGYTATAELLKA